MRSHSGRQAGSCEDPGEEAGETQQARERLAKVQRTRVQTPRTHLKKQVCSLCASNPALWVVETGGLLELAGC